MLAIKLKQQGGFCDNAAMLPRLSVACVHVCLPCQHGGCIQTWIRWVSSLPFFCFPEQSPLRSAKKKKKWNKAGEQTNKQPSIFPIPRVALSGAGELRSNRVASWEHMADRSMAMSNTVTHINTHTNVFIWANITMYKAHVVGQCTENYLTSCCKLLCNLNNMHHFSLHDPNINRRAISSMLQMS